MQRLLRTSAIVWLLLGAAAWTVAEPVASLQPTNYVDKDFAGVLDAATQSLLNELCRQVEQKAHAQIAVVTVNLWRPGRGELRRCSVSEVGDWEEGKDRGVLILLATEDHKYWTGRIRAGGDSSGREGRRIWARSGSHIEDRELFGCGHIADYARRVSHCAGYRRDAG